MPSEQLEYSPRRAARRARKRHTWRNALLLVGGLVVVLIACVLVYVGSIGAAFNDRRQTVDVGTSTAEDDGVLNILLLGSDSRGEGQDTAENKGEDGERSDTMMLVHVPKDRSQVYIMSIVRDLWVEIPGEGERKVNAALGLGGYPLVMQTVEELVGVPIDHLAVIDFEGFKGLTGALGGVQLCNPNAFSSGQLNPSFYPAGEIVLDGNDALRFVRERKAFLAGDFQRVENQRIFVSAIVDQLMTVETLANPQRVMDVVHALTPFITVDEGLDAAKVAGYAWELRNIRPSTMESFTVPHGDPTEGPGGASIVEQDEDAMRELRKAFRNDEVGTFLEAQNQGEEQDQDGDSGQDPSSDASPSDEGSASPSASATESSASALASSSDSATASASESSEAPATPAPVCAGG